MMRVFKQNPAAAVVSAALALTLLVAPAAPAQNIPDQPSAYVVDQANVIDGGTEQKLNRVLAQLEADTTVQVVVLTVPNMGGAEVREFGLRVAERWQLGQQGKDNGLLVLFAQQERRLSFETGYGLEAVLTDAECVRAGREIAVPHFKRGQFSRGLYAVTMALAQEIASSAGVQLAAQSPARLPSGKTGGRHPLGWLCPFVFIVFVLLASAASRGRYGRYRRHHGYYGGGGWLPWLFLLGALNSGRRSSGWGGGSFSGGGFGGGGFGGFGGGGGGSFGGGGGSVGW